MDFFYQTRAGIAMRRRTRFVRHNFGALIAAGCVLVAILLIWRIANQRQSQLEAAQPTGVRR
jgi:sensor domain CHASE-containing protein